MANIELFKKYCEIKGQLSRFAYGYVKDGIIRLDFLSGKSSSHIMYKGAYIEHGELYSVNSSCCGYEIKDGSCTIGKPKAECVDNGCYSENKCAVYSPTAIELDTFELSLTLADLRKLIEMPRITAVQNDSSSDYSSTSVVTTYGKPISIEFINGGSVVSRRSAELLKECGFNAPVCRFYQGTDPILVGLVRYSEALNHNADKHSYSAPTPAELAKWMKENQSKQR